MYVLKGLLPSLLLSQGNPLSSPARTLHNMLSSQIVDVVPNIQQGVGQEAIVRIPDGLYAGSGVTTKNSTIGPKAIYDGGYPEAKDILVRIANGGAGQSGLIGAWADAFIKHCVEFHKFPAFRVGWYLGDTTESLGLLAAGAVDIAVTYNKAAETQSVNSGAAAQRVYGFRDHFLLVGPKSNPAQLDAEKDDVLTMFNKIVASGNADVASPPDNRPPTRFLSRYDKSATNIKESELFITIGQVPWALTYSKWYHQYPLFPLQALAGASALSEYTLTDRGTWLSTPASVKEGLQIYKTGSDDADDPLLNPGHVLLGSRVDAANAAMSKLFMKWVAMKTEGQKVVAEFKKEGQVLYSQAPDTE